MSALRVSPIICRRLDPLALSGKARACGEMREQVEWVRGLIVMRLSRSQGTTSDRRDWDD
jgi:hypothetical protein